MSSPENLKKLKLLLLGTEMGLCLSQDMELMEVERLVKNASTRQVAPKTIFSLMVAEEFGIQFTGEVLTDCFGFYEKGNLYCGKCNDNKHCLEHATSNGLGSLVNPAVKQFNANAPEADSRQVSKVEIHSNIAKQSDKVDQTKVDRDELTAWIGNKFNFVFPRAFKTSISFITTATKEGVLKFEQFSPRNYYIYYVKCTEEMGKHLMLESTLYGWRSTTNDIGVIKTTIEEYFNNLSLGNQSALLRDAESFRQEIVDIIVTIYGLQVHQKKDYDAIVDHFGYRIMYLEKFTPKAFCVRFARMTEAEAVEANISLTSFGHFYKRNDKTELKTLICRYLDRLKQGNTL